MWTFYLYKTIIWFENWTFSAKDTSSSFSRLRFVLYTLQCMLDYVRVTNFFLLIIIIVLA